MRSADDLTAVARIRDAAIDQVGQHGFSVGLRAIAQAAGVSAALVIHHFGSKEGLLRVCDDYIAAEIKQAKSESLTTASDPASWLTAVAEIESFAHALASVRDASGIETLAGRWGIRRTSPRLWSTLDWMHDDFRKREPTEFGLLDLNRYANL